MLNDEIQKGLCILGDMFFFTKTGVEMPPAFIAVQRIKRRSGGQITVRAEEVTAAAEGDLLGLVLFISADPKDATGDTEYKLAQTIAAFLGRHMES